jgi:ribosomal protein L32
MFEFATLLSPEMSPELSTEIKLQCFSCNSILVTTIDELTKAPAFDCRFCGEDLRPHHRDPKCNFCSGAGYAMVNDVVWICLGADD